MYKTPHNEESNDGNNGCKSEQVSMIDLIPQQATQ
jgi:hypothetical protein